MRSILFTVVGTALAALIVYYLTTKEPELIYTLTDPITLTDEQDSKVGIQQLEVINVGDVEAKKIRVLIKYPVISCERDPSVVDRIEEYNNPFAPGNFENLKKLSKLMSGLMEETRDENEKRKAPVFTEA